MLKDGQMLGALNYLLSKFATIKPLPPPTPPPGQVPEPHINRFSIGDLWPVHPGSGRKKKNCAGW